MKKKISVKKKASANEKEQGFGIASLVLGIVSIVLCWVPLLGLILGILGIIFYIKQIKISPSGMATAGLVTSIIGLVFSILINLMMLLIIIYPPGY